MGSGEGAREPWWGGAGSPGVPPPGHGSPPSARRRRRAEASRRPRPRRIPGGAPARARHGADCGAGPGSRPGGAGGAGAAAPLPLPAARRLLLLAPPGLRTAAAAAAATARQSHLLRPGPARPCARPPRPDPPPRLPGGLGHRRRLTLKFLAVLLAAGMLAFLGAVICIIASVPLASAPRGRCPAAPTTPRPPPRPRARSAAWARCTARAAPAGPRAARGAGGSAHPLPPVPLFSRFLCTPLAAARRGPSQGRGAGRARGLLLLQSTAEQLRRTALQQEARIRADQDIRELTGKLGRCERPAAQSPGSQAPPRHHGRRALGLARAHPRARGCGAPLRDHIDRIEVSAAPRAIGDPAPGAGWEGLAGVRGASRVPRPPPAQGPWGGEPPSSL